MTLNPTILKKLEKKRTELGKSSIDFIAGKIKREATYYSGFNYFLEKNFKNF